MKSRLGKKAVAIGAVLAMTALTAVPAGAATRITKDETVYVVTEANGAQREITVSDHLTNTLKSKTIHDTSSLTEIENVKGDETFEQGADDALVWKAGGNDIFYQGTTAKETPVTMDISYFLDGKKVDAKDLESASGDVKITIDYHNSAKVEENGKSVTVPFIAMTGFIVEDETLTDIDIDHGKVIDDGDKQVVVGMAAPGLKDALDINSDKVDVDLDLNDSITITGKAKEFDVQDMMTVVTNSLFEDIDTEDFDELDMDDEVKELQDGAKKLRDGSDALYDGIDTLYENVPELKNGTKKLKEGADALKAGTDKALTGAKQLSDGTVKLRGTLKSKMDTIASETGKMESGTSQIIDGLKQIKHELQKEGKTPDEMGAIQALGAVSKGLKDGADQAGKELGEYVKSVVTARVTLGKTKDGVSGLMEKADSAYKSAGEIPSEVSDDDVKAMLGDALDGLPKEQKGKIIGKVKDEVNKKIKDSKAPAEDYKSAADDYKNAAQTAAGGIDAADSELKKVQPINGTTPDPEKDGLAKTAKSMGSDINDAVKAVDTIKSGIEKIPAALGDFDEDKGADQGKPNIIGNLTLIKIGLDSLGTQAAQSVSKEGALTKAMNQLVYGSKQLEEGEVSLAGGSKELANGMEALQEGADDLSIGAKKLDKGAKQLRDGMETFYKEGIEELVKLYQDDLKGSIDNMQDVMDAGKDYKIFTELADGMDGSVKFIYKTSLY